MKMNSLVLAVLVGSSATAMADTPFRISNPTIGYTKKWTTNKLKTTTTVETKKGSYSLWTAPFSPEFRIKHDDWYLYLVPSTVSIASGGSVGLGMNMDTMEVGAWLSLSQGAPTSAAASGSSSRHEISVFGKFKMPMDDSELELQLRPGYVMGSTGVTTGTKSIGLSGFSVAASARYVMKCTDRFEISPNLSFKWSAETTKTEATTTTESTDTVTELKLSLADFRLKF